MYGACGYSMLWKGIPETHVFSALGLLALCYVAVTRPHSRFALVSSAATAIGMLVTNLPVAGALLSVLAGRRSAVAILLPACLLVAALFIVESALLPRTWNPTAQEERAAWVMEWRASGGLYGRLSGFLVHGHLLSDVVPTLPERQLLPIHTKWAPRYGIMDSGRYPLPYLPGLVSWALLAVAAISGLKRQLPRIAVALLAVVAVRAIVFVGYAECFVLFAPNWLWAVVLVVGLGFHQWAGGRARRDLLAGLSTVLISAAGVCFVRDLAVLLGA